MVTMRPISPGTELRYIYDTPPTTPEPPIAHKSASKLYSSLGSQFSTESKGGQAKWTPEWRDRTHFVFPYPSVRKSKYKPSVTISSKCKPTVTLRSKNKPSVTLRSIYLIIDWR